MNLLTDHWIPVRPINGRAPQTITLEQLLCGDEHWILSLPRDDMELAALQLLICLVQVCWIPEDDQALRSRIAKPLTTEAFKQGAEKWLEMFCLDHPKYPFMQVKGVKASKETGFEKLLIGLSGARNCVFVNEPGQAEQLCSSCAAIALFNYASNAPSICGGVLYPLRGVSVTTFVQSTDEKFADLRTTVWLNILTLPRIKNLLAEEVAFEQVTTWSKPILLGEKISAASIGLAKGLFWQPASIALSSQSVSGHCTCCGTKSEKYYKGFVFSKFKYEVGGVWPHPHSPRIFQDKKGEIVEKFLSLTTAAPLWTHIHRFLVKVNKDYQPAEVVKQAASLFPRAKLHLIVGGYRNDQARIIERRHDVMTINEGWQSSPELLEQIAQVGLNYKKALCDALVEFVKGKKNTDIKGVGMPVNELAERQYYSQSNVLIPDLLATLDFENPVPQMDTLRTQLHKLCTELFEQVTAPYQHHPKLVRTLAVARKSLRKHLSDLKQLQGGQDAA